MSPIRAVLFDVGNTLCHIRYGVIADVLVATGIPVTSEEVRQAEYRIRPILDRFLSIGRDSSGAVSGQPIAGRQRSPADSRSTEAPDTFRHYLALVLRQLKIETVPALEPALARIWAYHVKNNLWSQRDEAALPVLRVLKESGYTLGVISNSDGQVAQLLQRLSLTEQLDFIVDSGRVGAEKPHPEIFRIALQLGGLRPSEAVYVGDIYSVDILGANRVGLKGILIDPIAAWAQVSCLKARGLPEVAEIVERIRREGELSIETGHFIRNQDLIHE